MNMRRIVDPYRIKYESEVKDEVTGIIESSRVDLSKLNSEKVAEAIKRGRPNNIISVHLAEESFDYLKSLGIHISNNLLDPNAIRKENLERMVNSVMGESYSLVLKGMKQIFRLVSIQPKDPNHLDHITYLHSDEIQHEAVNILTKAVAGKGKSTELVIELGAIPPLISLLDASHDSISSSVALILANIVSDNAGRYHRAWWDPDAEDFASYTANRRALVLKSGAI